MRQKVMAKNVALRRRQELDKMKMQEIMQTQNNPVAESSGLTSKMSSERDGEKSEPESEPSSRSEGNHISALALIILNFYNNDPKIAMDSIKKVASELSSLIHADPVTSDSTPNIQQGETDHFNCDLERTPSTTPNGMFSPGISSSFTPNSKKVILPATPSMYLSPFHPFALKTYRSALAQGPIINPTTRRADPDIETIVHSESKVDSQASLISESPFSIKSLTSEQTKSKSAIKSNQVELASSAAPFFGMPGHLRGVGTFAFHPPQQPFACVPFPSFHGLPPSIWSKNWYRRDPNVDLLSSQSPY